MHTTSNIYKTNVVKTRLPEVAVDRDPVEEYLTWKRSYALPAFRSYAIWVKHFYSFTGKAPEHLTYTDFVTFSEHLKLRYSPRSVQFALTVVRNYLRFFSKLERLGFPLFLARVKGAPANSHRAASEPEFQAMVRALQGRAKASKRDVAILMLLHDTGMRVGELCSLEVDDIEQDFSAVIRTEKTTERRRVFWNADTDLVIQQYLVERINAKSSTEKLFVAAFHATERGLTTRSVERIITQTAKLAGIEAGVCPHSFRHSFIHRLAKLSVPDAVIAKMVGHRSPGSITPYTNLSRPEFEEMARRQLAYAVASK